MSLLGVHLQVALVSPEVAVEMPTCSERGACGLDAHVSELRTTDDEGAG